MRFLSTPSKASYDVVIIGGAIMGSATAWFLATNPDFNGSVLVVERDPSYGACSTAHTNSCMRQQFSTELNVKISQYAATFVKNLRTHMGGDTRVPTLEINNFGYMYLAQTPRAAEVLRENQRVQVAAGAETRLMQPDEIRARYPFYNLDDILLGSINTVDEGYWDGAAVFDWWMRQAQERGIEYVSGEVVALHRQGSRLTHVTLSDGTRVACGHVVNASGPRAARTAAMADIALPVEPRKRYTYVFKTETPLDRALPLTIDPSGVHVREVSGGVYQAGGHTEYDPAVAFDDFQMDPDFWQEHVWPTIAARIPAFEAVKVISEWAGHYAMNTFDHNAILGPHPEVENFIFLNGFSGHGLQQSPAMGRGTAEWLTYGTYRTLDLRPFHYERVLEHRPIIELAVI